ncbi:hypothetical protein C9J03_17495 [Photobacterium gaetbulicola]|uniref:histidine kinase n=1 Tax=Photobacterium gaetbulicola Gung47 TaxID=658445 RepID=A0A0C5WTQ6_9GAMM|nr:thermostable hemolysin [Photobacterium gaetbulicola]AJR06425.1 putative thermostable hemolysin [Photobacterium gaetbulicola Gung47]PSU05518.1 hypothetical protein C9J03_17495 [Photobacterium gaetbulicola]
MLSTFQLQLIGSQHPLRRDVEGYIAERYRLAFNANVTDFMPLLLAVFNKQHQLKSACGTRVASTEPLFLEEFTNPNIIVTVNDSGLPIPLDIRDKIFEKFFRAHTERGDGAGLGMSIVRDIASLHCGEICLLPASSGNGNTFQVTLPAVNSLTTPK